MLVENKRLSNASVDEIAMRVTVSGAVLFDSGQSGAALSRLDTPDPDFAEGSQEFPAYLRKGVKVSRLSY
jgi:hypothetical protein